MKIKSFKEYNESVTNIMVFLPFLVKINLIDSPVDNTESIAISKKLNSMESDHRVIIGVFLAKISMEGGGIDCSDDEIKTKWEEHKHISGIQDSWDNISPRYLDDGKFRDDHKIGIPETPEMEKGNILFRIDGAGKDSKGNIKFNTKKIIGLKEYYDDPMVRDVDEINYLSKPKKELGKHILKSSGMNLLSDMDDYDEVHQITSRHPFLELTYGEDKNYILKKTLLGDLFIFINNEYTIQIHICPLVKKYGITYNVRDNGTKEIVDTGMVHNLNIKEASRYISAKLEPLFYKYGFNEVVEVIDYDKKMKNYRAN